MNVESESKGDSLISGQWVMVFALLLGITLWVKDGTASGPGQMDLPRLLLLVTTGIGAVSAYRWKTSGSESTALRIIISFLLVLSGGLTLARPPGYDVKVSGIADYQNWMVLRGMATALFLAAFFSQNKARRFLLIIGLCFLAGSLFWTISHARNSTIDVVHVFRIATKQVESGINPYAGEMPRFYSDDSPLMHKDKVTGAPLSFGFVYPLGALFLGTLGEHLFSDYRFFFFFLFIAGLSTIVMSRSFQDGLTFLFPILLYPRIELLFERGWVDGLSASILIFSTSALAWSLLASGALFSVFLATKPYFLLFWPYPLICCLKKKLPKRPRLLFVLIVAPFLFYALPALDAPGRYFWSIFFINFKLLPRVDSLSFYPFWSFLGGLLCFLLWAAGAIGFASATRRQSLQQSGFLLLVWILFGIFLFSKIAFMNYYFCVIFLISLFMCFCDSYASGGLKFPDK